jgi:hypothetical protein
MLRHTDALDFLGDGGELGRLMRAHPWSGSPLGMPDTWAQPLCTVVSLMLGSRFPMFVAWGDELGLLYNDAYSELLGSKHPTALGARFQDVWSEIWSDIAPLIDTAWPGGDLQRRPAPDCEPPGFRRAGLVYLQLLAVRGEGHSVAGMFCTVAKRRAECSLSAPFGSNATVPRASWTTWAKRSYFSTASSASST